MSNTLTCPNCHEENAFFNGGNYECPDCDFEWDDSQDEDFDSSYEQDEFEKLIKLKEPYFILEHGKLYECDVEYKKGKFEKTTIIPLAFKEGQNRQFILTEAKMLLKQHPEIVKEVIKMDFQTLWNDGLIDFPPDFEILAAVATTQSDGTYLDGGGMYYYEFKKTDEI